MKFETRAIHVGQSADPATGATITPIYQTSTFTQEGIGKHRGYEYSRLSNPTRSAFEQCLASLEGGRHAVHWDGRDERGRPVAAGVYAVRLIVGGIESRRQVIALR